MLKEIADKARPYDGTVPEDWVFLGMKQNQACRFRYYKDAAGQYWYTIQRIRRDYMQMAVREEDGMTYARNVYTGPRRKRRRLA